MLSYQHAYHAANAADVHKHGLLAWTLAYLAQKPKPLTYIETHAGRALYDLESPEAQKTGEAAAGIGRTEAMFAPDHPYLTALAEARSLGGTAAYPGSPLIARTLLRPGDRIVLTERHPQELAALRATLPGIDIRAEDGPAMARAIAPPTPRRGLLLVDPSYEVKDDYAAMPLLLRDIHRKWPVGVLMLWYPVLTSGAERAMTAALDALAIEGAIRHQARFAPARPGHGMTGSGLFVINPPWGFAEAAQVIADILGGPDMTALPDQIDGYGPVRPYSGQMAALAPANPPRAPVEPHRAASLAQAIRTAGLTSGAMLSFHHHLRNGDRVMAMVLAACRDAGLRNLHIAPSSLFPCHADLIPFLRDGTVTRITTSYMNGPLADAVKNGQLKHPAVLQTHGGRAHSIESGQLRIDAAFLAAPAVDRAGNVTGAVGPQACGPLGYAMTDAAHAAHVIAVTDTLTDSLPRICIPVYRIDQIVLTSSIGNAAQIVSGTTGRPPSATAQAIATMTVQLIAASGLLKNGFSFQTGAGGTSLAVARALGPVMQARGVTGDFAAGGITGPHVGMFRDGLFRELWDVQAFDLDAVASYRDDARHYAMSASLYASPARADAIANRLDVMILGAAEIDTDFNVNVTQASDGRIIGGSGGHADTAACANLPIVTTTLTAGGFAKIVRRLTCLTTPGATIGAVVTEAGIAVHPSRPDLAQRARDAGLPVTGIEDLRQRAEALCPPRDRPPATGRTVAVCEYRDGSVLDVIRLRSYEA